jgi:hypothetical protein
MKHSVVILVFVFVAIAGCTKDEDVRTSGTDTIDNLRYQSTTWFTYGFLFSTAKLVSTEATPKPDITVDTASVPRPNAYLQGSVNSSFFKYGSYNDEASAMAAFNDLKQVDATQWEDWANPIMKNDIWIFRSTDEKYTKIRIVDLKQQKLQGVPVTEVTFQWVHQPDGSLMFP